MVASASKKAALALQSSSFPSHHHRVQTAVKASKAGSSQYHRTTSSKIPRVPASAAIQSSRTKKPDHRCPVSGCEFTISSFSRHTKRKMLDHYAAEHSDALYECTQCPPKSFFSSSEDGLSRHARALHNDLMPSSGSPSSAQVCVPDQQTFQSSSDPLPLEHFNIIPEAPVYPDQPFTLSHQAPPFSNPTNGEPFDVWSYIDSFHNPLQPQPCAVPEERPFLHEENFVEFSAFPPNFDYSSIDNGTSTSNLEYRVSAEVQVPEPVQFQGRDPFELVPIYDQHPQNYYTTRQSFF